MDFFYPIRLSIASANAFLLVYSVTDPLSFVTVKQRFEEIKEQRSDFQVNNITFYLNTVHFWNTATVPYIL